MSAAVVIAALAIGALAALVRYLVSTRLAASVDRTATALPVAVLLVNVVGSLIAGGAYALAVHLGSPELRLVLIGGLAGGLTTFSTFGVETIQLVVAGRWRTALASVAANLVGGLVAVAVGWAAMAAILS